MNNLCGWIGTITGIIGSLLLAFNFEYSKYGYFFFTISAICWVKQGIKNSDNSLILLNTVFIGINALGIYLWFF